MHYNKMLSKNYALEICNFLVNERVNGIDFDINFRTVGDHKGLHVNLFILRRQFEFNIYNVHHEPVIEYCFGCDVELTKENRLTEISYNTGLELCKECDFRKCSIDDYETETERRKKDEN